MTDGKKCEKAEWVCCPPGKCAYRHLHPTANCPRENLPATPQQAEAVPSDVVRDAERYRWLTDDDADASKRRHIDWIASVIPLRSKKKTDSAIDAAIAQQKAK